MKVDHLLQTKIFLIKLLKTHFLSSYLIIIDNRRMKGEKVTNRKKDNVYNINIDSN